MVKDNYESAAACGIRAIKSKMKTDDYIVRIKVFNILLILQKFEHRYRNLAANI